MIVVTFPLPQTIKAPIGAKMRPIMNKVGSTAFGVKIGCQAFSLCCLNAVSDGKHKYLMTEDATCWPDALRI